MCEWGTHIRLRVPIRSDLAHDGKFSWAERQIDACIAPLVERLNESGLLTANACCGHGKMQPEIIMHDGTSVFPSQLSEVRHGST